MRDADNSVLVLASPRTLSTGVVALIAGIAFAVLMIAAPENAHALPQYAAKEGKPCGYCHVNPAGGGPRNAKGKQYQANGHKFKK